VSTIAPDFEIGCDVYKIVIEYIVVPVVKCGYRYLQFYDVLYVLERYIVLVYFKCRASAYPVNVVVFYHKSLKFFSKEVLNKVLTKHIFYFGVFGEEVCFVHSFKIGGRVSSCTRNVRL